MSEFPFVFGPLPEEVRQRMEEQQDRRQAEIQSWHHEQDHFFSTLTREQTLTLSRILRNITNDESGRTSAFYEGVCQSILTYRYNVCAGCGVDHAEEFAKELLDEAPREPNLDVPDGISPDQLTFDDAIAADQPQLIADKIDEAELADRRELMDRYNVEEDPNLAPFLRCRGCGLTYVSLEDRMVKAPDDCHGCTHKSKWG